MIHHYINNDCSGEHYAVGVSSHSNKILLQVQERSEQARIAINIEQAKHLIQILNNSIIKLKKSVKDDINGIEKSLMDINSSCGDNKPNDEQVKAIITLECMLDKLKKFKIENDLDEVT